MRFSVVLQAISYGLLAVAFFSVFGYSLVVVHNAPTVVPVEQLPTHTTVASSTPPSPSTVSFLFSGDMMLARNLEVLSDQYGLSFATVYLSDLPPADYFFTNFESANALPHRRTPSMVTTFSTRPDLFIIPKNIGITHASLANNHTYDYGQTGFDRTAGYLAEQGIVTFGHPLLVGTSSVVYLEKTPQVSVIALQNVTTAFAYKAVEEEIAKMKSQSEIQIAYIHWGDEYVLVHNRLQQEIAEFLIDQGIDFVIGHHPHVTQDIGWYKERPIFYSLGNFIFDQYFSSDVQEGLMVTLEIESTGAWRAVLHPTTAIGTRSQTRLMNPTEKADFLLRLANRSHPELKLLIRAGVLASPQEISMITP